MGHRVARCCQNSGGSAGRAWATGWRLLVPPRNRDSAAVCDMIAHRNSTSLPPHSPMKKPLGEHPKSLSRGPRGLMLCVFLSGAAGLIYQVAWTKALGLVFGHAVYAIATVLAAFMAGLAVGSAYLGRW